MMKMNRKMTPIFLGALLAALMFSSALASSAAAAPTWKFNGKSLEGKETILGGAEKSHLTVPGMTTTCDNFLYEISIVNSGGTGSGEVLDIPLFNCYTNTVCTVEATEAAETPWPAKLKTVSSNDYIVIEGVHENIEYGNELCILNETIVEVEGTAGGRINNATESATFDTASFEATGTELEAFGNPVEWEGVFPAEAFEWHREEALSVS